METHITVISLANENGKVNKVVTGQNKYVNEMMYLYSAIKLWSIYH